MIKRDEIWQIIAEKELASVWPQWKITRVLGRGAYGNVYEIQKVAYGHVYRSALKIIQIEDPSARTARFLSREEDVDFSDFSKSISNEIGIMEQLKGAPNIVVIEDHAVLHEEGVYSILIRMELLENLNDYIERNNGLSESDVLKLGTDICQALSYCEKNNILHRDIKDDNLYFSSLGDFKIGDFGVSKIFDRFQGTFSMTSIGTPSYIAPEIYNGEEYDSTIDLYSLGIVLYKHLNHGRLPFCPAYPAPYSSEDIAAANRMRMQKEPLPLPSQASKELGEIICRACSPSAKDRYSSASEFKAALESYRNKLNGLKPGADRSSHEKRTREPQDDNRSKIKAILIITAVIAVIAVAEFVFLLQKRVDTLSSRGAAETADSLSSVSEAETETEEKAEAETETWTEAKTGKETEADVEEETEKEAGKETATKTEKENVNTEILTDNWEDVIAASKDGSYRERYRIGDTKELDLGIEGVITMRLVAMDEDELADGSGKAPMTWVAEELLHSPHKMNDAPQDLHSEKDNSRLDHSEEKSEGISEEKDAGGWELSEMRAWLRKTILPLMPEKVQNGIREVTKYSYWYNTRTGVASTDTIWIPSGGEVFYADLSKWFAKGDGVHYVDVFFNDETRIRRRDGETGISWWWLRSEFSNQPNQYDSVKEDGSYINTSADSEGGVLIGFCL